MIGNPPQKLLSGKTIENSNVILDSSKNHRNVENGQCTNSNSGPESNLTENIELSQGLSSQTGVNHLDLSIADGNE